MGTNEEHIAKILAAWHERRSAGEAEDPEAILRNHPELADQLREGFDALAVLGEAFPREDDRLDHLPAVIGEYRLMREIGRGGMGVVYEAEQISMHRRVALKVLSPAFTGVQRAVRRFQIEARAAGLLHHTNIVPVHAMGREKDIWYYAMELVEGQPLSGLLEELRHKERPRSAGERKASSGSGRAVWFRRVAEMFAGVAEALDLAHIEGIIHRDIKPSNLLLDADGTLKLVDFGLAHLEGAGLSMTRTGDILGTPAYMSPEQAQAKRVAIDHRTDIYSLGATLYEVLTLSPPFDGENLQQLCTQIISTDPALPRRVDPRIPRDLETIALKAMEKSPEKRYPKAAELAQDLRSFHHGEAIRARRVGWAGRCWRRVRRQPVRAALIAALLVISTVAGLLGLRAGRETNLRQEAEYDRLLLRADRLQAYSASLVERDDFEEWIAPRQSVLEVLDAATRLMPERPEAWWLRAFVPGRTKEQKIADVDRAARRGLSPRSAHLMRAHFLVLAGDPDRALLEQQRAEKCGGETTPMETYLRGRLASWRGDREHALQLLDEALATSEPGSGLRYLTHRARARLREKTGDLSGALSDYQATVGLGDERMSVQLDMAYLWRALGKTATAKRLYDKLLDEGGRSEGDESWLALLRSAQRHRESDWREAISRAAVAVRPKSDQIQHHRFHALMYGGDPQAALEVANSRTKLMDGAPDCWWSHQGTALMRLGNRKQAIASCQRAVELDPDDARGHFTLGNMFLESDRLEEAIASYRRAIKHSPDYAAAHGNLGEALRRSKELDEAFEHLHRATELDPDNARAHNNLGLAFHDSGRFQEAIASFDRATELDPHYHKAHMNLGVALRKSGKLKKAIESYRRSIELDREDALAHHNLGLALHASGRLEEAIASFQRATELNSRASWAHNNLGAALSESGRHEEAIESCSKAIVVVPSNADFRRTLGNALRDAGKFDEAIESYQEAIRIQPDYAEAYSNLAWVLWRRGEYRNALAAAQKGYELALQRPDLPHALHAGQVKSFKWDAENEDELLQIIEGELEPLSPWRQFQAAKLAYRRGGFLAAARLAAAAFAAAPELAEQGKNRYNAACYAALAGCGKGEDAGELSPDRRAELRWQALDWMRAQLDFRSGQIDQGNGAAVAKRFQHWLSDSDLEGVREPAELKRLPGEEAQAWSELWDEVRKRLERANHVTKRT